MSAVISLEAPETPVEAEIIAKLQQTVSPSRLTLFLQCRLKFWFRYVARFLEWKPFSADGEWQLKVGTSDDKETGAPFQISSRRWRFIGRQVPGNYPNWRQVIPDAKAFTTQVEFETERTAVIQLIDRMPCDDEVNFRIGLEAANGKVALLGRSTGAEDWTRVEVEAASCRGADVKIFLNRHLLAKALQFGLGRVEIIDRLSPLRLSQGGRQMIIMPTRPENDLRPAGSPVPAPKGSAAQDEPQPSTPPPIAAEPSQEKTPMPENTKSRSTDANHNGVHAEAAEKSALEIAGAQLEIVRGELRSALASLNKLGDALKTAQREQKASGKERLARERLLETARSALGMSPE
jgi:hypothetical protein